MNNSAGERGDNGGFHSPHNPAGITKQGLAMRLNRGANNHIFRLPPPPPTRLLRSCREQPPCQPSYKHVVSAVCAVTLAIRVMNSEISFFSPPPPMADSSAVEADVFSDARGENVILTEKQSLFNEQRRGGEKGGAIHCIVYKVYCFTFMCRIMGFFFVVALFAEKESLCLSLLSQGIHAALPAAPFFFFSNSLKAEQRQQAELHFPGINLLEGKGGDAAAFMEWC